MSFTFVPSPPWNITGTIGQPLTSFGIQFNSPTPGEALFVTLLPTFQTYALPPFVDVYLDDVLFAVNPNTKGVPINLTIASGSVISFRTTFPNVLTQNSVGAFRTTVRVGNESSTQTFINVLTFLILGSNVFLPAIRRFMCSVIVDASDTGTGTRNIIYPCAPNIPSTLLSNSIGTLNLKVLVRIISPSETLFEFDPLDDSPTGLSFNLTLINDQLLVFNINNAIPLIAPVGITLRLKLIRFNVIYDFVFNQDFQVFTTTITGRGSFTLIDEDNVEDGADLPPEPDPVVDPCDLDEIPRVIINSLITDDFDNLAGLQFSVIDIVKYDGYFCKSTLICPNEGIYCTEFLKYPAFQTVLKGKVCKNKCVTKGTLNQKVEFLIKAFGIDLEFFDFLYLLGFYASARYILSGLLYGKFSVKFLLGKYYKSFLRDLANSRFRKFLIVFTNSEPEINFIGYEKYFLYDLPKCDKPCIGNKQNNNTRYGNTDGCQMEIHTRHT